MNLRGPVLRRIVWPIANWVLLGANRNDQLTRVLWINRIVAKDPPLWLVLTASVFEGDLDPMNNAATGH